MTTKKKIQLAKDPNTSPHQLARLAKDKDWRVRYWVADNHNCPLLAAIMMVTSWRSVYRKKKGF